MRNWIGLLALSLFFLVGCAPIKPYRTQLDLSDPCSISQPSDCPTDAFFQQPTSGLGYNIHVGIIEFDDQGALMRRELKNQIVGQIDELGTSEDVLMVVFAHGWKNNAAPDNGNLRDFLEILTRLEAIDQMVCRGHSCEGRRVVGVFLGWRGLSASVEPFKTMSFWNRKKRAHRVGQDGATEVLSELAKINARRRNNRLVIVGHSFGGALIYTALQQQLIRDTAFLNHGSVPRNSADLVVLVNPAFEAARFTSLHEKSASMDFKQSQRPVLAIFTSVTDTATKTAFPIGRTFSTLFTKYNPDRPDQSKLNRTAIGHYGGYQTHALVSKPDQIDVAALSRSVCGWEEFQKGETDQWDLGVIALQRKSLIKQPGQRNNPYYNVAVDDVIVSGHNKIWGDQFMEFLYRFVGVQDAMPCHEGGEKR